MLELSLSLKQMGFPQYYDRTQRLSLQNLTLAANSHSPSSEAATGIHNAFLLKPSERGDCKVFVLLIHLY